MEIQLLPANNGDCIIIEFVSGHFILIDGGYVDTYRNYLRPKLIEIAAGGGIIDALVVTHIDSDHISGIIKLLEEELMPITIREIWYNGYRHIQSVALVSEKEETVIHKSICKDIQLEEVKSISAKQGCTLSRLISMRQIPWNKPVAGGAIMAPLSFSIGTATIHILSPNKDDLDNLCDFWKKSLIKDGLLRKTHSEEFWDDAYEFCISQDMPGFHFHEKKVSKSYDLQKEKCESYDPDRSASNGSSISFVLESEGKRVLFLGDAHAETIADSLKLLYGESKAPYGFEAVKLSHHGSFNNNSPELFNLITTDKWLVSTNGDKYSHPDLPTLAHIITKVKKKKIFFNYNLSVCEVLKGEIYHRDSDFEIIVPKEGRGILITI